MNKSYKLKAASLAIGALLAIALPWWAGDQYQLHLAALICVYWILIAGLNLVHVNLGKRLIHQNRIAKPLRRRRSQHKQPTWCNHGRAESYVARIDKENAHCSSSPLPAPENAVTRRTLSSGNCEDLR